MLGIEGERLGSIFGKMFRVTTFGESHNLGVGVVVEGTPAGIPLSVRDIQKELERRRPGRTVISSPRKELDRVEILSGVFEGKTIGTPIAMLIRNVDVNSRPYEAIKDRPRPGHADLTYFLKYGHVDWRGGGRASGRETVARVAAGAVAKKFLSEHGIEVLGHTVEAAGIKVEKEVGFEEIKKYSDKNSMRCADPEVARRMERAVLAVAKEGDSTGGIVEVRAIGVPPGLGDPIFDKLDAEIAHAMMSIGAIKAVEIGAGTKFARMRGSEANDPITIEGGKITISTNNSGGILGGISVGAPIIVRLTVKPTPSISLPQHTVNIRKMKETMIELKGRFDPNICPRVVPVAEAMLAIVLADHMLRSGKAKPDRVGG